MHILSVLLKFVWPSNNEIEGHKKVLFVDIDNKLCDFSIKSDRSPWGKFASKGY